MSFTLRMTNFCKSPNNIVVGFVAATGDCIAWLMTYGYPRMVSGAFAVKPGTKSGDRLVEQLLDEPSNWNR